MKYLCLVYYNEQIVKSMTQEEWDGLNQECIACVEDLTKGGHFLDGAPLQTTDSATTLRVECTRRMVSSTSFESGAFPQDIARMDSIVLEAMLGDLTSSRALDSEIEVLLELTPALS